MKMALDRITQVTTGFERPEWYFRERSFNIRLRAETVRHFLQGSRPGRILDIGCGDGSNSLQLLTPQNHVTLLDRSANMLARAMSKIPPGLSTFVEILNEDFMTAKLEASSYDLVICLGVLAYVEDVRSFISRVCSLLKPSGTVIMECTDSRHLINRLGRKLDVVRNLVNPPTIPLILHTSSEVTDVFNQLGYGIRGAYRYALPPPGVRFLLSQAALYRIVRTMHGTALHNRLPCLGDECIYHFSRARALKACRKGGRTEASPDRYSKHRVLRCI